MTLATPLWAHQRAAEDLAAYAPAYEAIAAHLDAAAEDAR